MADQQNTQEAEAAQADTFARRWKEGAEEAQDRAQRVFGEAVQEAKHLQESVSSFVRERPVLSLFIVAGVSLGTGVLLSTLLPRSSSTR